MALFSKNQFYLMILDIANNIKDESIMALATCHLNDCNFTYDKVNKILTIIADDKRYNISKNAFLSFLSEDDFKIVFEDKVNQSIENINKEEDILKESDKKILEEEKEEPKEYYKEPDEEDIDSILDISNDIELTNDLEEDLSPTPEEIAEYIENEKKVEPEIPTFSKFDIAVNDNVTENKDTNDIEDEEAVDGVIPFKEKYPYIEQKTVHVSDCVYKTFRASISHKDSLVKDELFFYIYPLVLKENSPSTEIVTYCYWRGKNITASSLDGQNNLVQMNVGEYEFLIRGTFVDGKFDATINTTGISAATEDQLVISQAFINNINSGTINSQNGHIKFKYKGWESSPDKIYEGIIEIFPTDFRENSFLIVRRIEDYIDYFYTDTNELGDNKILIQTENEMKELIVWWDEGVIRYELILSDYNKGGA